MNKSITIFLFLYFTIISHSFAQATWTLLKNEDGIKVYSRNESDNSSLKELKVEAELKTSLSALISVLSDKASYPKWVYRCANSELLKKNSEFETYHYQSTDMPWPVQNRDIIIHTKITQNPSTKEVIISCNGVGDYIPKKDNYIRITSYRVTWKLTPLTNNTVKMEYIMAVNPAGSLPSWLVNMSLTEGPINTIKNLRNHLLNYQEVTLNYIKN